MSNSSKSTAPAPVDPASYAPVAIDPGQTTSATSLEKTSTFGPTRTAYGRSTKWGNVNLRSLPSSIGRALGITKKGGRRRHRKSRKQRR